MTWKSGKYLASETGRYDESAGVPIESDGPIVWGTNDDLVNTGSPVKDFFSNFWKQGGPLSKAAMFVPGQHALSRLHDWMQIGYDRIAGQPDSILRSIGNVPAMVPATVITYAALMDGVPAVSLAVDRTRRR